MFAGFLLLLLALALLRLRSLHATWEARYIRVIEARARARVRHG